MEIIEEQYVLIFPLGNTPPLYFSGIQAHDYLLAKYPLYKYTQGIPLVAATPPGISPINIVKDNKTTEMSTFIAPSASTTKIVTQTMAADKCPVQTIPKLQPLLRVSKPLCWLQQNPGRWHIGPNSQLCFCLVTVGDPGINHVTSSWQAWCS